MEDATSYQPAGFFIRFAAGVIDWFLVFLAASVLFFTWYGSWLLLSGHHFSFKEIFAMSDLSSEWAQWIEAILELFIYFGYFAYFHSKTGITPGKRVFKIQVLSETTGSPLTLKRSVIRSVSYVLSALPFGCGFLMVLFHPKKRALHDLIAGSQVIYFKNI